MSHEVPAGEGVVVSPPYTTRLWRVLTEKEQGVDKQQQPEEAANVPLLHVQCKRDIFSVIDTLHLVRCQRPASLRLLA